MATVTITPNTIEAKSSMLDWTTTRIADNGNVINLDQNYDVSSTNTLSQTGGITITIDSNGNYVAGTNDDDEPLNYFDATGTKIDDFFQPTDGWATVHGGDLDLVRGVKFTYDEQYLYVLLGVTSGHTAKLLKFDAVTGLQEGTTVALAGTGGMALAVDEDDNVYVGDAFVIKRYDSSLNLDITYTKPVSNTWWGSGWDIWIDDDLGYVFVAGAHTSFYPVVYYQLWAVKIDNSGSWLFQTINANSGAWSVTSYNGYVYITGDRANSKTIWKIDPATGLEVASYDGGSGWEGSYIWVDWLGRIAVKMYRNGFGQGKILIFDENLTLLNTSAVYTSDEAYSPEAVSIPRNPYYPDPPMILIVMCILMLTDQEAELRALSCQVNRIRTITYGLKANSHYVDGMIMNQPSLIWSSSDQGGLQERNVCYPLDYSHLNGETVQVLGDGKYLGTETVVNGNIALDNNTTVNHVGLKITSKLQPMKINGEVDIKRIRRLIPNFNETVGGEYGEELTKLYSTSLIDNDNMDIDSDFHTGYVELPFNGSYNRQGDLWFVMDKPLPYKLLGVGINLSEEIGGSVPMVGT